MEKTKYYGRPALQRKDSAVLFSRFASLPTEIRLRIWQYATPRKPRIILVYFDPRTLSWSAKNFTCGLPALIHVNHEARSEALKGLTRAFDAYVDLEIDTIYPNDPAMSLRRPMLKFAQSEHAINIRHLAIDLFSYSAWLQNSSLFPDMSPSPPKVMRKYLPKLMSFSLVLSADEDWDYGESNASDDSEDYIGVDVDVPYDQLPDDHAAYAGARSEDPNGHSANNNSGPSVVDQVPEGSEPEGEDSQMESLSHFDALEQDELRSMGKIYYQHSREIQFVAADNEAMYLSDCWYWTAEVRAKFREEKDEHPDWMRPVISIMLIAEGPSPPDTYVTIARRESGFHADIHSYGDYRFYFDVASTSSQEEEPIEVETVDILASLFAMGQQIPGDLDLGTGSDISLD